MKFLKQIRNKYVIAIFVFIIYILFLDDTDIFAIARQKSRYAKLVEEKAAIQKRLSDTQQTLKNLDNIEAVEKYAREEKYFKKDDEEIFVILYE